jgi:hypothetical protein
MKHPVWRAALRNGDLVLCAGLVLTIAYFLRELAKEKPDQAIVGATIVGAMLGGAAILLGSWIARYNERTKAVEDLALRRSQLKMLIVPELVNVAAGLLGADDFIGAACTTLEAEGGTLYLDLPLYVPRNMPFTFGLGIELCALDPSELDALVTLRSNLDATRDAMTDFMARKAGAYRFQVQGLRLGLRHTMEIAAECFERFEPERKVLLHGREKQGELFSEALRRH